MELADAANPFVEHSRPWDIKKDPSRQNELRDVCTISLNLFRQLAIYLAPVLPRLVEQCGELLCEKITDWQQSQSPLLGTRVQPFKRMMDRIQLEELQKMIEDSKDEATLATIAAPAVVWNDSDEALNAEPLAAEISIEDFAKVDLRIARVLAAEQVPEANKLLKLTLSLGGDHTRQVFAGIKAAYDPEKLVGSLVVMVANLAPRKMRFGMSEGMVTAAGPGGPEVFILRVDEGAQPGQRVH